MAFVVALLAVVVVAILGYRHSLKVVPPTQRARGGRK